MDPRIISNVYRLQRRQAKSTETLESGARSSPYFELQVETKIQRTDLNTIYTLGDQLVEIIGAAGLKIRHSCWNVSHDVVQLYNYWTLADANTLTAAELALPDNPAYAKFERLILEETKDLVIRVAPGRVPVDDLLYSTRYVYMRVQYKLETKFLAEFQARLEASISPFACRYDWMLGDTFLGITGDSGAITQVWLIPESTAGLAERRILTTAWQPLLREPPVCVVLEPTPTDPILGELNSNSFSQRNDRYRVVTSAKADSRT